MRDLLAAANLAPGPQVGVPGPLEVRLWTAAAPEPAPQQSRDALLESAR
jgi:hypothetical protein